MIFLWHGTKRNGRMSDMILINSFQNHFFCCFLLFGDLISIKNMTKSTKREQVIIRKWLNKISVQVERKFCSFDKLNAYLLNSEARSKVRNFLDYRNSLDHAYFTPCSEEQKGGPEWQINFSAQQVFTRFIFSLFLFNVQRVLLPFQPKCYGQLRHTQFRSVEIMIDFQKNLNCFIWFFFGYFRFISLAFWIFTLCSICFQYIFNSPDPVSTAFARQNESRVYFSKFSLKRSINFIVAWSSCAFSKNKLRFFMTWWLPLYKRLYLWHTCSFVK